MIWNVKYVVFPTHLEVQIKFADDLGSIWAVDGYGVDWEVRSPEGPVRYHLRCDHGGAEEGMFLGMTTCASP